MNNKRSSEINEIKQQMAVSPVQNNIDDVVDSENDEDTNEGKDKFYEDAEKYWSSVPATVDGMLGGFGVITNTDIEGSREFLGEIFRLKSPPEKNRALDCGAGIGRITKSLLLPVFNKVDLVEQDRAFSEKAKELLSNDRRLGEVFNVGLQKFNPESDKYDVVWCQWVLGHLTDADLVEFFSKIRRSLTKFGMLVIKENVTSSKSLEVDDVDSSVTRPLKTFKNLIKAAKFKIVKLDRQTNFPKGLYPVYMFACKPEKRLTT